MSCTFHTLLDQNCQHDVGIQTQIRVPKIYGKTRSISPSNIWLCVDFSNRRLVHVCQHTLEACIVATQASLLPAKLGWRLTCVKNMLYIRVCVCRERERFGCLNSGWGKCGNGMKFAYVFHISYCCRVKDMLMILIYWKGRHFVWDQ
jgi:hypothetical protein